MIPANRLFDESSIREKFMALIVFFMDLEEGHIIPTFWLADSLKKRGHEILYLSIPDNEKIVRQQGFGFYPVLEDIYPLGFAQIYKNRNTPGYQDVYQKRNHMPGIIGGSFTGFFKKFTPGLVIVSSFLPVESLLIYYRFKIRPVLFNPMIRPPDLSMVEQCTNAVLSLPADMLSTLNDFIDELGTKFTSLGEFIRPVGTFCELIACSREFDIRDRTLKDNIHYIGPSIRNEEGLENKFYIEQIQKGKKIIYASLGSQSVIYGDVCDLFFSRMVNVMKHEDMRDFHLILSTGPYFDMEKLEGIPENVTVSAWFPQIDVLKIASLVITHGGLGTVKESIYFGVPMIVLPLTRRDQPYNANLVEQHKLGIRGKMENIEEETMISHIKYVINSKDISDSMDNMKRIFREAGDSQHGAYIIERLLAPGNGHL
jgi:zeaxanthin glucosyltransferase